MEIKVSNRTGFCSGVSKAYDQVKSLLQKNNQEIYIYGELVHNNDVIAEITENGAVTIKNLEDIPKDSQAKTVVIRAHGITKFEKDVLKNKFFSVIDMTCPIVKNLINYIKKKQEEGYYTVVYGEKKHPEIQGVIGNIDEKNVLVTMSVLKIDNKKVLFVAQTTAEEEEYKKFVVEMININKFSEVLIKNTICPETILREKETEKLSNECDVMLVLGGKHSSNTNKLFNIAKKYCKRSFHIENVEELKNIYLSAYDKIGIVTGSSTPDKDLHEVLDYLRDNYRVF